MTDETTAEQLAEIEGQGEPIQVREGRWRTRSGEEKNIRSCEPLQGAYYVWPWTDGFMTFQDNGLHQGSKESPNDLIEYLGPIEEQPQSQSQPEPQPVQVREGRWRTRDGNIRNVTRRPAGDGRNDLFPWWDAAYCGTWTSGGRYYFGQESPLDLLEYIGPIEQQPQPQPPMLQDADDRIRLLKQANDAQAETIGRLQTEARDLNMEIGGLERQLLQRDARIRDLETMHAAATQAVVDAGKQNDALRLQVQNRQQEYERQKGRIEFLETLNAGNGAAISDYRAKAEKLQGLVDTARGQLETSATEHDSLSAQLAAVKAELASVAADRQQLRIELDAAQQVPADSPELRQLRADLEQMTLGRDTYQDGYNRVLSDLETARETAKAEAVEAIAEWLEPIRAVDNEHLANETLQHLPQIMRHLVGLDSPEDVD